MNRKQKLALLGGIAAAIFGILNVIFEFYHPGFDIYLVAVAMLTVGCIYVFKNKENGQTQDKRDINKQ